MASYTTNYNLKKPEGTDFINVQDLNDNADAIDSAILAEKQAVMEWAKGTFSNPNLLINGGFDEWSRGTIFEATATNTYTCDRWATSLQSGTVNIYQNINDGTLPFSSRYYLGLERTGALLKQIRYIIENGGHLLSKKQVTLSYWAKAHSNAFTSGVRIGATESDTVQITTTWQKFTHTLTVVETSGNLPIYLLRDTSGESAYIANVKLELGSVATPFVPRPYGEELALCQRYYLKYTALTVTGLSNFNGTSINVAVFLPTPLRTTTPTVTATIAWVSGNGGSVLGATYNSYTLSENNNVIHLVITGTFSTMIAYAVSFTSLIIDDEI